MSNMTKTIAILGVVAGLGVAALPLSTYAADPDSTNRVQSTDGEKTAVSNDAEVNVVVTKELSIATNDPKVDLSKENNYRGSLQVNVINTTGKTYNLSIKQGSTGDTLKYVDGTGTDGAAENTDFAALVATQAAPAELKATADNSTWGYTAGDMAGFAGVSDTDAVIFTSEKTDTGTAGENTEVTFGAAIKTGQGNGTYTGNVIFTASITE